MKTLLHRAETRGHAQHGWLNTHHTFSFADYYDPERIHFGALRVLNDDSIQGGKGFGMHPHDNMEVITIPLTGRLEHQDSMGNKEVMCAGEIQVMSAGTGIFHSEFNADNTEELTLLQIWVFPKHKNTKPRYSQISLSDVAKSDELYPVVTPNPETEGAWIGQDAWFYLGDLSQGWKGTHSLKSDRNGVYLFVIDGSVEVQGIQLNTRDGLGLSEVGVIDIQALSTARILLMEVPMVW